MTQRYGLSPTEVLRMPLPMLRHYVEGPEVMTFSDEQSVLRYLQQNPL